MFDHLLSEPQRALREELRDLVRWVPREMVLAMDKDEIRFPKEFLAAVEHLPKDTPIYLDSRLAKGLRGEDIARDLHAKGFSNLFLATGHSPESLPPLPWIKKIVGKEPPWG